MIHQTKKRGFTLIELMVYLTVASIILTVSGVAYYLANRYSRGHGYLTRLESTLTRARTEAMINQFPVVICPTDDGQQCAEIQDDTNGWGNRALIVFISESGTPPRDTTNEPIIAKLDPSASQDYLLWRGFPNTNYIRMEPNGLSGSNGNITYCAAMTGGQDHAVGAVRVNRAGRVMYLNEPTASDGSALTCN